MTYIEALNKFWGQFCTTLYDCGFADAVSGSGARAIEDHDGAIVSMAYMTGYAQCARICCDYMGTAWKVAHLVAIAAGMFLTLLREIPGPRVGLESIESLCDTYTRELKALVSQ